MRNQLAWIVLGGVFSTVSAAAQESAPSSTSLLTAESTVPTGSGSGGSTHVSTWDHIAYRSPVPQGEEEPYGLNALFMQHHGEFLQRHERYDPALELRTRLLPNQSIKSEPGSFDLYEYDLDVEAAAVITTESYLLFGLYNYTRHYQTSTGFGTAGNVASPTQEGGFGDETLTAAGIRFGIGVFLDNNLFLEVETNPGVYSDLEDGLGHKDYDFPSSALFTNRLSDEFFFKFGVRYNQIYEDAPWLPYLGFRWEINEALSFDLLLPEFVELSYSWSDSTALSWGADVRGAEYRVHSTSATGKQGADLHVQEVITYLGLTHRFSDTLSLQARTGLVLAGSYDLTTGAASFDPTEGALSQGFYADITLGIDW